MDDTRTLQQLAREVLLAQAACNLSGVVHSWSRAVKRLRELCPELGTDGVNRHPLNRLYADKLCQLAGGCAAWGGWEDSPDGLTQAYQWVQTVV